MLILGLDVSDANLSFVHDITDEVIFYVDVPRSLAWLSVVGHLDSPLVILHDVNGVTLECRHDKGLYLTEK